jgi:hypothetical protein
LYIFDFSRTTGPILTRLDTIHGGSGFKFVQVEAGDIVLQGEITAKE